MRCPPNYEVFDLVWGWKYLVCFPVPEKVNWAVHSPLDHRPASGVVSLVTPNLHKAVGVVRPHQVHAAGRVTVFQSVQTISEWTWTQGIKSPKNSIKYFVISYKQQNKDNRHCTRQQGIRFSAKGFILTLKLSLAAAFAREMNDERASGIRYWMMKQQQWAELSFPALEVYPQQFCRLILISLFIIQIISSIPVINDFFGC